MTRKLLALALLLTSGLAASQIPAIEWKKSYGGTLTDALEGVTPTSDGYLMIGSTQSGDGDVAPLHGSTNDRDVWVVKTDLLGEIVWQKTYGGTQQDFGNHIAVTPDGGFVMAGRTYSNNGDAAGPGWGGLDAWIVKADADGNIQWQKRYGSGGPDAAYHVTPTSDGGYIFAGYSGENSGQVTNFKGFRDAWVVKIDGTGNLQWQRSMGGTMEDYAFKVIETLNGYAVGGETLSASGDVLTSQGGTELWFIRLDVSGNMLWNQCYGGPGRQELSDFEATPDGGYILAGNTAGNGGMVTGYHSPGTGNFGVKDDYWVVKISATGALEWQKCYGGTDNDVATAVGITADGGYIITGYSDSNNFDNDSFFTFNKWDYWTIKTDAQGNIQWQETHGGSNDDAATSLLVTPDNGYLIAGFSNSVDQHITAPRGGNDFFVVKLAADALSNDQPKAGSALVYPNPAQGTLYVEATEADVVWLTDLMGRTVLNGTPGAVDVSGLPRGVYLLQGKRGSEKVFVERVILN